MRPRPTLRLAVPAVLAGLAAEASALDPLGPIDPNGEEQHLVYTLNRARKDPAKYGERIGVDLSGVVPRPPLAINRSLTGAARFHAREMLEAQYFGHTSEVTGDGPNQMAVQHGYDVFGQGLARDWGNVNNIESIARGVNLLPRFPDALALLIEDKGVPGLGHRVHLLATVDFYAQHREIGAGAAKSGLERIYVIDTANVSASDLFLTGVVYDDGNGNGMFDAGEGLGGVTVDAGGPATQTLPSGGWSLRVGNGSYDVTCQGGAFVGSALAKVVVAGNNVEVDFRSGLTGAQVDFVDVDRPAVPGPTLTVAPSAFVGDAPLNVQFDAATTSPGATDFSWVFGDGGTSTAEDPAHQFAAGLHRVVVEGTDPEGTGRALAVVAVAGPGGAGEGTTPPANRALAVKTALVKVLRAPEGADVLQATLQFELPAGLAGTEGLVLAVCAGGVEREFTLAANGVGKAPDGSKAKLTYRRPKAGAALAAGVRGKIVLTLKGDLDAEVEAAGLRDATESRLVPTAFPFGVRLGEEAWAGSRPFTVKSKAGIKSVAKPAPAQ